MASEKQQHCCERWAGQREMTFPFANSHYISFAASQNFALWLFLVLDCLNFLESDWRINIVCLWHLEIKLLEKNHNSACAEVETLKLLGMGKMSVHDINFYNTARG